MPKPIAKLSDKELQDLVNSGAKKYVRYDERAKVYSMGRKSFIELAKDAKAIFKVKGIALVNIQKGDHFIEEYLGADY